MVALLPVKRISSVLYQCCVCSFLICCLSINHQFTASTEKASLKNETHRVFGNLLRCIRKVYVCSFKKCLFIHLIPHFKIKQPVEKLNGSEWSCYIKCENIICAWFMETKIHTCTIEGKTQMNLSEV